MTLSDHLRCPHCQGRLTSTFVSSLGCDTCRRSFPVTGEIANLPIELGSISSNQHAAGSFELLVPTGDLPGRIMKAANVLWPSSLGNTIQLGSEGSVTQEKSAADICPSLLVVDADPVLLQTCRDRIGAAARKMPALFVVLHEDLANSGDAAADTIIGTASLAATSDTKAFLKRIHQVLKANGQAAFAVSIGDIMRRSVWR